MDKIAWVAGPSKVLYGKTYAKYNVSMRQSESARGRQDLRREKSLRRSCLCCGLSAPPAFLLQTRSFAGKGAAGIEAAFSARKCVRVLPCRGADRAARSSDRDHGTMQTIGKDVFVVPGIMPRGNDHAHLVGIGEEPALIAHDPSTVVTENSRSKHSKSSRGSKTCF